MKRIATIITAAAALVLSSCHGVQLPSGTYSVAYKDLSVSVQK